MSPERVGLWDPCIRMVIDRVHLMLFTNVSNEKVIEEMPCTCHDTLK